jgi:hypothetical protein
MASHYRGLLIGFSYFKALLLSLHCEDKFVAARRRNQHARRACYPKLIASKERESIPWHYLRRLPRIECPVLGVVRSKN